MSSIISLNSSIDHIDYFGFRCNFLASVDRLLKLPNTPPSRRLTVIWTKRSLNKCLLVCTTSESYNGLHLNCFAFEVCATTVGNIPCLSGITVVTSNPVAFNCARVIASVLKCCHFTCKTSAKIIFCQANSSAS